MSSYSKVLVIDFGGTILMRDREGVLGGSMGNDLESILDGISGIKDFADVDCARILREHSDSTEIKTSERIELANLIYKKYDNYDGFVVLHGTDTLTDTAAALTYMLIGLGKPIILTGSQIPISKPGTDGIKNIYWAIKAATLNIGEIVILFESELLRGIRTVKSDTSSFNAFYAPQLHKLGDIGNYGIRLSGVTVLKRRSRLKPKLFTSFDTYVEFYQPSSGSDANTLESYISAEDVHGVVIGGFGSGNIPSRIIPSIRKLTDVYKPVIVTTTSLHGSVNLDLYETGRRASEAVAISAYDMTRGAATQKLMFVLGIVKDRGFHGKKIIPYVSNLFHRAYRYDVHIGRGSRSKIGWFVDGHRQ